MIVSEVIRRTKAEDLKSDLAAFWADKKLTKSEVVSVEPTETSNGLQVIITYENGTAS